MEKLVVGFAIFFVCVQGFSNELESQQLDNKPEFYDITKENLTFRLYTRNNRVNGEILRFDDRSKLISSNFKGSLPTVLVTHGFMDTGTTAFIMRLKEGFLNKHEVNYISLDWSPCAKNLLYNKAVKCMKKTGQLTGEFLKYLKQQGGLNIDKTHLIGHSLGAQLLAFASLSYGPQKTIGRITGLDPAGPLFEYAPESERLNPNSAKFVDIIHTCRIFTGMKKPIGTVDFYPNGGYNQPGCAKLDMACQHHQSHRYFLQSINDNQKFAGKRCTSLDNAISGNCTGPTGFMGYSSDKSSPGIYYVKVTGN